MKRSDPEVNVVPHFEFSGKPPSTTSITILSSGGIGRFIRTFLRKAGGKMRENERRGGAVGRSVTYRQVVPCAPQMVSISASPNLSEKLLKIKKPGTWLTGCWHTS